MTKKYKITDAYTKNKMLCPMCEEGELVYTMRHSVHMYICDVCPLVTFEYSGQQHIIDLVNYLEPDWRITPE